MHILSGVDNIEALIIISAVVGLGSFLFHTIATRWAEWGDVLPILALCCLTYGLS